MDNTAVGRPYIYAVSGFKNTGKTTLITKLIPELKSRGYKVAVIKHDGHDFEPDVPGTDSFRHRMAGAFGTAVYSSERMMVTKECTGVTEHEIVQAFPEADIILLEGLKDSTYPKYICDHPRNIPDVKAIADTIESNMKNTRKEDTGDGHDEKGVHGRN